MSSLFPLAAEEFHSGRHHYIPVSCGAAFETYIMLVIKLFKSPHAVNVIVQLTILTRHPSLPAACHVNVLEIFAGGNEGGLV